MKRALKVNNNGPNQTNFPAIKKPRVSPMAAPYNHFYSFYNHKLKNNQRSKNDSKGDFKGSYIKDTKMQYYSLS